MAQQIIAKGLVPIIEPEININSSDKAACEAILRDALLAQLEQLSAAQQVIFKLTLPEESNFYAPLQAHANTLKVVALSGGYNLEEACQRLSANDGMIASFSRALTNDLRASQSDEAFNATLDQAIAKIYAASVGNSSAQAA